MKFTNIILLAALLAGCRTEYSLTGQQAQRLPIDQSVAVDSSLVRFLQPYKQQLDRTMTEVLVRATTRIEKGQPNGPLNDLLTDAMIAQVRQKTGQTVDVSHLNYTGIRNNLPLGDITVGSIYEVMPFDNALTLVTMNGEGLMRFLNHFVTHDGTLVVGGIRATVRDKKVESLTFTNGRTFSPTDTYLVAMSDYIANGGSDVTFMNEIQRKREEPNYLLRDAFIDYFRQLGKSGQPLKTTSDGRITFQ